MNHSDIVLALESLKDFSYESEKIIIKHLSMRLHQGQCISIMGPSGCGKSTILKILGGVQPIINDGRALCFGNEYNSHGISIPRTEILLVFQDGSLFPFFTVKENVLWGAKHSPRLQKQRVEELTLQVINDVGMTKYIDSFPHELSGGQKQRASLARALVFGPKILLLDEPFSSLDIYAKQRLEELIIGIKLKYDLSIILTTHDIEECLYCSDVVYILSKKPVTVSATIKISAKRQKDDVMVSAYRELLKTKIGE